MCREQALGDVGETSEEEGDTEEEPRNGKHLDRGLERKSRYQTAKAAKNTEQRIYSWISVCPLVPESNTI